MADRAGITEASKMLTHGEAYSSRYQVNVIIPGVGQDEGNHVYPPARGDVPEYVRARVREALDADERVKWARRPYVVTVRQDMARGAYRFTVWSVAE